MLATSGTSRYVRIQPAEQLSRQGTAFASAAPAASATNLMTTRIPVCGLLALMNHTMDKSLVDFHATWSVL
jgi:hypothetical protein